MQGHTKRRRRQARRCLAGLVAALTPMVVGPALALAQEPGAGSSRPFEISDNSFLVEEALNQEPGVFQNILTLDAGGSDEWAAAFTQEWPLASRAHQISFTVPYSSTVGVSGLGDAFVHYRLQVMSGDNGGPAFSPRVSLIVPSGRASKGLGHGNPGWEVNLPFSRQVRDYYLHWNVGFSHVPAAESGGHRHNLLTPRAAASVVWRARPMINVLLEGLVEWADEAIGPGSSRRTASTTILPGLRTGWNVGDAQTIIGAGIPITVSGGTRDAGVFLYLSHELPFARQ